MWFPTSLLATMTWVTEQIAAAVATVNSSLAGKQPLDSDLTAISSLSTTSFGRSLLTQADASATRSTIGLGSVENAAASTLYVGLSGSQTISGPIGIGGAPTFPLDVRASGGAAVAVLASAGDLLFYARGTISGDAYLVGSNIAASGSVSIDAKNTGAGNSELRAIVSGSSAGDPFVYFGISGVRDASFGIDNSDNDRIKIGHISNPSDGAAAIAIGTDNAVELGGSFELASKTVGTLPLAAASAKKRFLVTDSTPPNRIAFCDGSAWYYEGNPVSV